MGVSTIGKRRAVFLDRDGVLNRAVVRGGKPYPPSDIRELEVASGVDDGCKQLRAAGFLLIGITNQPDVARGVTEKKVVEEINDYLSQRLSFDSFRVCYHDNADDCDCRKPRPGLILRAAADSNIDLRASFMVGDRWKDIEAGKRAGCQTVFIDNRYSESGKAQPDFTVDSFQQAVAAILFGKETPD